MGVKGVYSFDLNKRVQYIEGDFTSFECTEGGVYPEHIAIPVTYGKDADIKIKNYSGKPVTVSADALEGSEVRIKRVRNYKFPRRGSLQFPQAKRCPEQREFVC